LSAQNSRRDGGPVPDFAPPVPPAFGVWLSRVNRDEVRLGSGEQRPVTYQPPPYRRAAMPLASGQSIPPALRLGIAPSDVRPLVASRAEPVRAYRVIASIPRALTLDFLA